MRVRNDSAFFKRNITPLLGFHGHGGLGFVDDVSGVDWAVQNLTDIGAVKVDTLAPNDTLRRVKRQEITKR